MTNRLFILLACVLAICLIATAGYSQVTMQGPVMRIESQSIKGTWVAYDPTAAPILDHICGIFFGAYVVYEIEGFDTYYLKPVPEYRQYANFNFCMISPITHDQAFKIMLLIANKETGNIITVQTANEFLDRLIEVKLKSAPIITYAEMEKEKLGQEKTENHAFRKNTEERKKTEAELEKLMLQARDRINSK